VQGDQEWAKASGGVGFQPRKRRKGKRKALHMIPEHMGKRKRTNTEKGKILIIHYTQGIELGGVRVKSYRGDMGANKLFPTFPVGDEREETEQKERGVAASQVQYS